MNARTAWTRRGEDGMTVTELLIAITITALIMIPLTMAIFVGLRSNAMTGNRIDESNGVNKLAWYFAPDVQNATTVAVNTTESSNCPAPMAVGLLLTGPNGSVSYYRGTGANQGKLYRRTCAGGAASASVPVVQYLSAAPAFAIANDTFGNWRLVTATVTQLKPTDRGPYTASVQASRRVN